MTTTGGTGELDITGRRECPTCGMVTCRLARTVCRDGRELVGWTCLTCGGLAPKTRGGLWVGHGVLAEQGIDRSRLPVRADHRSADDNATLAPGLEGVVWRASSVTPAWWPNGR